MSRQPDISIVICTRNRAFILPDCLDALLAQSLPGSAFELVIVDNASEDHTKEIADAYAEKFPHFQYLREVRIGLSRARNRGTAAANGEWIIFLDDDSRAAPNFVERAQWVIRNFGFDCFGGRYLAWYKYGRPKWLPDAFGTKARLLEAVGLLASEKGFLSGGIMAVKKDLLDRAGGFQAALGMGYGMGYGEEDELQLRLREMGCRIGFDPEWIMEHCVLPEKLKVGWHLRSACARGRDQARVKPPDSFLAVLFGLARSGAGATWKLLPVVFQVLFKKDYYRQNMLLDLCQPLAFRLGQITGYFARRS